MKVVPIKSFQHDRRGLMGAGRVYAVSDDEGQRMLKRGLVRKASPEEYGEKVAAKASAPGPSPAAGEAQPSSASQAARASQQTTAKRSGRGGRKRRKKSSGA